jgi:hypothetical protein
VSKNGELPVSVAEQEPGIRGAIRSWRCAAWATEEIFSPWVEASKPAVEGHAGRGITGFRRGQLTWITAIVCQTERRGRLRGSLLMGNEQQSQLDAILRQDGLDTAAGVASVRAALNALMAQVPVPADIQQKPVEIGVCGIEVTIAGNESERVILYFHGGVYVIGSAAASVRLVGDLVRRTGVNAIRF